MKRLFFILLLYVFPLQSLADFIDLIKADQCESILEVLIEDDNIIVKLEIGEQDYQWFSDIIPKKYFESGFSDKNQRIRLKHFFEHQLVLQSGKAKLFGDVQIVEQRDRMPRSSLYAGQADSTLFDRQIIYVEIKYPLKSKIDQLSIIPPVQENYETTLANIGFIVYHNIIPINDLRFLSNKETLHLDWEDPWYSYFENTNISRHHSSSLMSFLYVEPYEIRHEILCRIKDLEGWIELDYDMDDVIEIEDQDSIKQVVANFLVERNIVHIDGEERKPIVDRIQFVEVNLDGVQITEIPKPLPYASAIIGVIFAYTDEGMPKEVTIHWDMFNDKIQRIPSMTIDPAGPWPYDLQPADSILKWTNFLKHYKLPTISEQKVESASVDIPVFTLMFVLMILFVLYRSGWNLKGLSNVRKFLFVLYVLLGILSFPIAIKQNVPFSEKKSYSTPEAKELINQLLKNTYRAFDFREEADVYDKLSMCIDTQLLQRIYLQTRKGMVIENQGGIEAKVDEVLLTNVREEPRDDDGLAYRCNWIVKGVVGHWGHKHQRVNQYDAIIKLRPVGGVWKMFNLEIIEEVRLQQ